jgi:hypothetical protein
LTTLMEAYRFPAALVPLGVVFEVATSSSSSLAVIYPDPPVQAPAVVAAVLSLIIKFRTLDSIELMAA